MTACPHFKGKLEASVHCGPVETKQVELIYSLQGKVLIHHHHHLHHCVSQPTQPMLEENKAQ